MSDLDNLDPWDRALLDALDGQGSLTIDELAEATGIPVALLDALVRQGLVSPAPDGRFAAGDVETISAGMRLVEAGLPLDELLELARRTDEAMRPIAAMAVEVFSRFVRDSVEATASDETEASRRLVAALQSMLPATDRLVGGYFRRLLEAEARDRLADQG